MACWTSWLPTTLAPLPIPTLLLTSYIARARRYTKWKNITSYCSCSSSLQPNYEHSILQLWVLTLPHHSLTFSCANQTLLSAYTNYLPWLCPALSFPAFLPQSGLIHVHYLFISAAYLLSSFSTMCFAQEVSKDFENQRESYNTAGCHWTNQVHTGCMQAHSNPRLSLLSLELFPFKKFTTAADLHICHLFHESTFTTFVLRNQGYIRNNVERNQKENG